MAIFIAYVSTMFRGIYACRLYSFQLAAKITATFIIHMPPALMISKCPQLE